MKFFIKILSLIFICVCLFFVVSCNEDVKTYKVTFDSENEIIYNNGDKIEKPEDPTKKDDNYYCYTFDGWYNGDIKWNFDTYTVKKSLNLVSKFTKTAIQYTITFMADGEQVGEVLYYSVEDKNFVEPQVPYKEDYIGTWESYVLDYGDIVVNANYALEWTVRG